MQGHVHSFECREPAHAGAHAHLLRRGGHSWGSGGHAWARVKLLLLHNLFLTTQSLLPLPHLSGYLVGIIRWLECGHASKPPGRMRVSEFTNGSLRLGTRAGRKDVREIRPAGSNSRMNG